MTDLPRRTFLLQSAAASAAAATVTVPGIAALATQHRTGSALGSTRPNAVPETLVLHVRDIAKGEIVVMADEAEVVYHDAGLVSSVLQALSRGSER